MKRTALLGMFLVVLGLVPASLPSPAQEQRDVTHAPFLEVLHVGTVAVGAGEHVEVEDTPVSVDGEAWEYAGRIFALLTRPLGHVQWRVAAISAARPGGFFEFSGVGFPAPGDYELMAAMFPPGTAEPGMIVEDRGLVDQGILSRRVQVRISGVPPRAEEPVPSMEPVVAPVLVSYGGEALSPAKTAIVRPGGDAVVRALGKPPDKRVYVVTQVPYTNRCFVEGPAMPGAVPGEWVRPLLLAVRGDPRQLHWQMRAIEAPASLPEGEMDCQSLWRPDVLASPPVNLITDDTPDSAGDYRVPYVAILQIGTHPVDAQAADAPPIGVNQGVVLTAVLTRLPEGAQPAAVTRCSSGNPMKSHGPCIPEGQPSQENDPLGPKTIVVWSLEFAAPPPQEDCREFEVRVAVFHGPAPEDWFDASGLTGKSVLSISPPVRVRVKDAAVPGPEVTVSRVGQA